VGGPTREAGGVVKEPREGVGGGLLEGPMHSVDKGGARERNRTPGCGKGIKLVGSPEQGPQVGEVW